MLEYVSCVAGADSFHLFVLLQWNIWKSLPIAFFTTACSEIAVRAALQILCTATKITTSCTTPVRRPFCRLSGQQENFLRPSVQSRCRHHRRGHHDGCKFVGILTFYYSPEASLRLSLKRSLVCFTGKTFCFSVHEAQHRVALSVSNAILRQLTSSYWNSVRAQATAFLNKCYLSRTPSLPPVEIP